MASRLKAVLFDKDGTLLDFSATWSPVLAALALDLAEGDRPRATAMLRAGGFDPETGSVTPGSVLAVGNTDDIVAFWFPEAGSGSRELAERINRHFLAGSVAGTVPVPGLAVTLASLAEAGLILGIATSDTTAAACAGIDSLGLSDRFACILGYDAVPRPKPAPDPVLHFCRAVSVRPEEVVVVGDSQHDLAMARAAGAGVAVGVLGGTSPRDHLEPLADLLIDSIAELPRWLEDQARI